MEKHTDVRWRGVGKGPHLPKTTGSMHFPESGAEHVERMLKQYNEVKERAAPWTIYIDLHWPNPDCPVKGFNVTISYQKDPGYELVHWFGCPYCGQFATLNAFGDPSIRDASTEDERQDREARQSVWQQLRRHRQGGFGAMLLAEFEKEIDIDELARVLLAEAAD
jgi:hypothetical protein